MNIKIETGITSEAALSAVNRCITMCSVWGTLTMVFKSLNEFNLFEDNKAIIRLAKNDDHISLYYTKSNEQILTITE
jgi:hypothetical protein